MAIQTYTEQLEAVQTAISAILTNGQGYSINGRTLSRADLPTLYEQETRLRRQVGRENRGGGMRIRGGTPVG